MKTFLTVGVILATFATALPASASGTRICAERDKVVQKLATAYGETRRSMGLGSNNAVVEVFSSDDTGTWTITVTLPDGKTCLIASGQAWEDAPQDLASVLAEGA